MSNKEVNILGVNISRLKKRSVLQSISLRVSKKTELISEKKPKSETNFWGHTDREEEEDLRPMFLTTPNPEICVSAQKDKEFLDILNSTDLNVPDAIGILWAAYYLSLKNHGYFLNKLQKWWTLFLVFIYPPFSRKIIPERISGSDLFLDLMRLSAKNEWKVFLLGAAEGVAEKCAINLKKDYPNLKIVGTFAGSPHKEDDKLIRMKIRAASPDLLFVAYGAPAQEKWISRNLSFISPVKFVAGIGGTFDFVSGKRKRAPLFMRKIGLEWFWRLILEPKSRLKRIYTAVITFPALVEKQKLKTLEK